MIIKKLMAYPVLMVGILFMVIFLFQLKNKGVFKDHFDKLQATSCRSALVMLDKRIAKNWKSECDDKNMIITISSNIKRESYKDDYKYKAAMYRELANSIFFISKNCANDSLERVPWVVVLFESNKMNISARTEGKHLARFATLTDSKIIAEHLKTSVQVKEYVK
ncbi:MAG: hypothetical protein A2381_07810 [Bdellovibrionales bacterium RIFOXYB1_FULL_37_110]|nr:MAG: hypothetical protein A2181_04575 [Bdellovibrionales bacterium RIFOXYA1_FULL_38_20]OFZ52509.1 MAG: hypothetical protein A2417_00530 [Bdellovibrionales bacterium RIFOXYC1_FULL_37_79]OFZ59711.1 MAG: hypothetical protein A2381_07810 [Bdellovibrionales bacterium RIFOXYB1_FULL_37_110]OFZ62638.1 MAG: hypothetical protein A2577_12130 [Bdellovibrionales bacterium RIFOXYD1_FULL_36_51]